MFSKTPERADWNDSRVARDDLATGGVRADRATAHRREDIRERICAPRLPTGGVVRSVSGKMSGQWTDG